MKTKTYLFSKKEYRKYRQQKKKILKVKREERENQIYILSLFGYFAELRRDRPDLYKYSNLKKIKRNLYMPHKPKINF